MPLLILVGFRKTVQMEKKSIVAPNRTAVCACFGAFRNLICSRSRNPNNAAIRILSHSSAARLIRFDDGESELKKSRRIREELMKQQLFRLHRSIEAVSDPWLGRHV